MRLKRLLLPAILLLVSVFVKAQKSNEFTVLQWNVWQEGTMIPGGYDAIINEIVRLKPDFVTFSEVRNYNKTNFTARVCASLQEKGLKYYSFYTYDTGLLSKHPITDSLTVFPEKNDHGSIYRLTSSVNGKKVAVYTAHLDYLDCAYYNARGYDGSTWKEIPLPASVDEIMKVNVASQRDDAIRMFIAQAEKDLANGYRVIVGGDFNEPSHRDWIEKNKNLYDHNGFVVPWTVTTLLEEAGFIDSYRKIYPNPLTHPGFTYPSDNLAKTPEKITWAPTRDTRDIITAAVRALDRIWVSGHRYAKAGIMLNDFSPTGISQLNLFDDVQPRAHSDELMKVLDGINHSGLGKVWFAGRGIAPEWQMKREMLSPAYTTRWSDIPVAHI